MNEVRSGPWTPAVHALLAHLRQSGFDAAPEPLGVDDQGRAVLQFIEAETNPGWPDPMPAWIYEDDATIVAAADWRLSLFDFGESKNVARLGLTRQIEETANLVGGLGGQYFIVTRASTASRLSGPLRRFLRSTPGMFILGCLPGKR